MRMFLFLVRESHKIFRESKMWSILLLGLFLSPFSIAEDINKPLLQELSIPKKNLAENKTIRLNCALLQGESANFEWYLNDLKLVQNKRRRIISHEESSELVIKSLSIEDLGVIKCTAKNQYGEDAQTANILMNVSPKWSKEPEDVVSTLNKEIVLDCDVKSYPASTVRWYKLDENKQVINEFTSNEIHFELTKETAGLYKCLAKNLIDQIDKIVRVGYFGE